MQYGDTIRRIVSAINNGSLPIIFSPAQVNAALGITFAGTFLPKHRVGNPDDNTPLFIQVSRGRYGLNEAYVKTRGFIIN